MTLSATVDFIGAEMAGTSLGRITQASDRIVEMTYPANLTDYLAKLQVRDAKNNIVMELDNDTIGDITVTPGASTTIEIHFTNTNTNVATGVYDYDFRLIAPITGITIYIITGKLEIYKRFTR